MLTNSAEKLLKQRYYKTGEDWNGLVKRVIEDVCNDEDAIYKNIMFNYIHDLVFLPNSPTLVNSGSKRGKFACFVVGPTEDTLENHLETLKDIAQVAKFGGGAGYSGTFIRPKNKPVNGSTHGYSYGPNAWSANVSSYMDMMTQSGFRKMALMYTLSSEHEDLDEFIGLKQSGNELHLYNFNQSVFASDRFMNLALQDNTRQHTQLRQLAINAWSNGEPGLLFDDTINNNTPYSVSGQRIYASNPSLRAGTKVLTDLGIFPIEGLENRSFKVVNLNGEWSNAECFLSGKHKQLWKVTLSGGITYFCTKEHKWPVQKDSAVVKTETDKLNIGDVLPVNKTIKRFGTVGNFNDGFNAGLNCATTLPSLLWNDASEEYTDGFIQGFMEASVHAPSNNVLIKLYIEEYHTLFDEFKDLLGFLGYYVEYDTEGEDVILKFHFPEDQMTRTILSVEPTDLYEDVWDISVYDETHCFSLAHVVTGNCGEQLLPPYGSCNLGSINISSPYFNNHGTFDFARLEDVVVNTTRFLDDVGITNYFPNIKFKEWYDNNRPIGLGIMGFADLLLQLEIRYGSNESLTLLSNIMETLQNVSYETSTSLGKERGIPSACLELNRRNVTTTTIAPTGSISFIANCSSAIEPIFSPEYTRIDERGEKYIVLHPDADKPHFVSVVGSMNSPTWIEHVDVQLTAQKYVDAGVSKTVNLPNDATVDTVYEVFQYAYLHGAKGITVYRDNSRQFQVLNHNKPETPKTEDSCTNGCNWVKTGKCSTCSTCGSSKCEL